MDLVVRPRESPAPGLLTASAMAMRYRATIPDFIELLHAFPTMSEALKIVAISRFKNPAKLSCCAD